MKKIICLLLAAAVLAGLPAAALAAEELVTDAYSITHAFDGAVTEYHVPRIGLEGPGAAAVNATIWDELYNGYVAYMENSGEDFWPEAVSMDYSWAVNDDTLSLWVRVHGMTDNDEYYIYNVSLTDGERLSDRELLQAAGVSRAQFNDLLRTALTERLDSFPAFEGDDYVQQLRTECLSDANLALGKPYMGRGGSLCAAAWVYTPAGAGRYLQTLTLIPGDVDSVLADLLDRCDSAYLTRSDLEGLDADSFVYALNGIYARAGRMFQSQDLQDFFGQFGWYEPTVPADEFTDYMLNDFQLENVKLLLAYKAEMGY